jgi:hypothetical protein
MRRFSGSRSIVHSSPHRNGEKMSAGLRDVSRM